MTSKLKIRIARPSLDLAATENFYCTGLGLKVLGKFQDHAGFEGIMLGDEFSPYHFEFTFHKNSPVLPITNDEDLIIFYMPEPSEWKKLVGHLESLGFHSEKSLNPYWDQKGKTFLDPNGYRIVLQNAEWK